MTDPTPAIAAENARLRRALKLIRDQEGKVCDEYELCEHAACRSSHAAWDIADMALSGESIPVAAKPVLRGIKTADGRIYMPEDVEFIYMADADPARRPDA